MERMFVEKMQSRLDKEDAEVELQKAVEESSKQFDYTAKIKDEDKIAEKIRRTVSPEELAGLEKTVNEASTLADAAERLLKESALQDFMQKLDDMGDEVYD